MESLMDIKEFNDNSSISSDNFFHYKENRTVDFENDNNDNLETGLTEQLFNQVFPEGNEQLNNSISLDLTNQHQDLQNNDLEESLNDQTEQDTVSQNNIQNENQDNDDTNLAINNSIINEEKENDQTEFKNELVLKKFLTNAISFLEKIIKIKGYKQFKKPPYKKFTTKLSTIFYRKIKNESMRNLLIHFGDEIIKNEIEKIYDDKNDLINILNFTFREYINFYSEHGKDDINKPNKYKLEDKKKYEKLYSFSGKDCYFIIYMENKGNKSYKRNLFKTFTNED